MKKMRCFLNDEQGQDLIEYTLLLAFICLGAAAFAAQAGVNLRGLWETSAKAANDGLMSIANQTYSNQT